VTGASQGDLELVITQAANTVPVRVVLRRHLTTLGSDPDADVQLPLLPAQWAVVQRRADDVLLRVVSPEAEHALAPGGHLDLGGVSVALIERVAGDAPLRIAELASSLSGVDSPDAALRMIVESLIASTGADSGAAIVREGRAYRIAVALDSGGAPLSDAERLLSDTVVRDVLDRGGPVCVGDLPADQRYANVPSVVALRLQSVLCVPMAAGERVLGALFLGKRDLAAPFSAQSARELTVLASMAVPFMAQLRRSAVRPGLASTLIGDSPAMIEVRRLIERVAPTDLCVLIAGETGTGKEVTARAIHAGSRRADRPMVALNCSAVTPSLLEAELFGHGKGAFTGAGSDREGRIEAAHGSTLFLDEVGDMPLPMQAALLRVLQEREVVRVGENHPRPVDFRLVAATNRDLDADVAAGRFREDLLFRLREVTIELPPLRARGDDAVLLARLFLNQAERELSLPAHTVAPSAEAVLREHAWPGNVRELRAVVRRTAVLCDGTEITAADLAIRGPRAGARQPGAAAVAEPVGAGVGGAPPRADAAAGEPPAEPALGAAALGDLGRPLAQARDEFVARYVAAVLERFDGDRVRAAEALGISVRSLYRYL